MARTVKSIIAVVGVVLVMCMPLTGRGAEGIPIALSKAPPKAVEAARTVADGIRLVGVRLVRTDKGVVYHFRTLSKGRPYKVVVTPDGEIKSIELITSESQDGEGQPKDK